MDINDTITEPLPHWASRRSDGNYMVPNSQLLTRDGRRVGNGVVVSVEQNIAHIVTDMGSDLTLTESELQEFFYPPIFIMSDHPHNTKLTSGNSQEETVMSDLPPCRTCAAEDKEFGIKTPPADHLATVNLKDGTTTYWPICASHLPFAMAAGWFPIIDAGTPEADAAIASGNSQGDHSMEVVVVKRRGVYDRGIIGVFSTEARADKAIRDARALEPDDYHDFVKVNMTLDVSVNVTNQ